MANPLDEMNLTPTPHVGAVVTEGDRKFATVMIGDPKWTYQTGGPLLSPPTHCVVVRNPHVWSVFRDGLVVDRLPVEGNEFHCNVCHKTIVFSRDVFLDANDQRAWANCCIGCNVLLCDACFGPRLAPLCPGCRPLRVVNSVPQLPPAP